MKRSIWGLVLVSAFALPSTASGQATTWLYAGGGVSVPSSKSADSDTETQTALPDSSGLLQLDVGLGVPANQPFVWGGLARLQVHGQSGVDLGFLARGVTEGFAQGGFGFGLDLGVSRRWWDQTDMALVGNLVVGAPWGLTLVAGASAGSENSTTYTVSVGIDFARLTVHRQSGLNWFPNPMPSPRKD